MSSSVSTPSSEGHMVSSGGGVADPCGEIDARSTQEEHSPSITSQKSKEEPNTGVLAPKSDWEGSISAITREDVLQTPDSNVHVAHSSQIGNTSFAIRERVLDDGYNWRKYGQKNVKGNEYIRSYYRCTYPSCQVKKQLDCLSDGKVSDTVYFGHHNHPKPQQDVPLAKGFAVAIVEGKSDHQSLKEPAEVKSLGRLVQPLHQVEPQFKSDLPIVAESVNIKNMDAAPAESTRIRDEADNEDYPDSKKQKKSKYNVDATPVNKHAGEHRAVVQTVSDVDVVNDGYRWRKYGQKMVKGSPHPRSYYRCSNPGCLVKKHVERASHDLKVVITTYEGTHGHDMPSSRTVTPKAAGSNISPTSHTGKRGSKSEECDAHSILSPETRIVEPSNGKSVTKLEDTEGLGSGMISSSSCHEIRPNEDQTERLCAENKPNERQSDFSSKKDDVGSKISAQSTVGLDSRSTGQLNDKSKEGDVVDIVSVVRPGIEGNCKEQQTANSGAIKS